MDVSRVAEGSDVMNVRSSCSVCGGVFPPLQKAQGWGSLGKVRPQTAFQARVRSGRTVGGGIDDGKEVQRHGYTVDNIAS